MFAVADAYERQMGRWSRRLAPLFVKFIGINDGDRVLDVGCGTGALSFTIAETTGAARIIGVDPSAGFIEFDRTHNIDPRVTFDIADAQSLPYPDGSFDQCVASLIVNFVPDAPKAAKEMRRVTKPGGVIGTCMWDNAGGMGMQQSFWDAANALEPEAGQFRERNQRYGSAAALSTLWEGAGCTNIELADLVIPLDFSSFDDLWLPYLEGQGPGGAYLATLSKDRQEALREKLRSNLLGCRADGPFTLSGKAWAVRGFVP
jgi:ubiquinone/menaquinone biosynthesis C-methylase UbiE